MIVTPNAIAAAALRHLGVLGANETAEAADASLCLQALKSLLDAMQLDPLAIIGRQEVTRTPITGVQSFTIGSGGDISSVRAPRRIESAFYRSNGVDAPIDIKSLETYLSEASKAVTGPPSYIAYEPSYALGTVYLYPAADGTSELHLWVLRDVVSGFDSLTLTTSMTLPTGYQNLLEWVVAEEVAPDFLVPDAVLQRVARRAMQAKKRLKRSNVRVLELRMPPGVQRSDTFNINEG